MRLDGSRVIPCNTEDWFLPGVSLVSNSSEVSAALAEVGALQCVIRVELCGQLFYFWRLQCIRVYIDITCVFVAIFFIRVLVLLSLLRFVSVL